MHFKTKINRYYPGKSQKICVQSQMKIKKGNENQKKKMKVEKENENHWSSIVLSNRKDILHWIKL